MQMENAGVLFSEMTPDASWEGEFNQWYDEEHIPLRMGVKGFLGAQRYLRDERNYLAVYDMESPQVLDTDAYASIKNNPSEVTARMLSSVGNFTRYIGRSIGTQSRDGIEQAIQAPILYPVFFDVPEDRQEEFDAWYDEDHVPTLLESPDWLGCRRFALDVAHPHSFNRLALHYLADEKALQSSAREKARARYDLDALGSPGDTATTDRAGGAAGGG